MSEGADNLYKMCHLFLQVAKLYIKAKMQETTSMQKSRSTSHANQSSYYAPADGTAPLDLATMAQFDPYLSALGLVPNSAWPMAGSMQGQNQNQNQNQNTSQQFPQSGVDAYDVNQGMGFGSDALDMNFAPPIMGQNAVQNWFSGSRYLMNLMEAGDDLLMADMNDVGM
jgi:hypothetical protein